MATANNARSDDPLIFSAVLISYSSYVSRFLRTVHAEIGKPSLALGCPAIEGFQRTALMRRLLEPFLIFQNQSSSSFLL
jgi:hypothetical protein